MNIKVFAILKEFFEEQQEVENFSTVMEIKQYLSTLNPDAAQLLNRCRFAINNEFVTLDTTIQKHDTIYIMPPSSGG